MSFVSTLKIDGSGMWMECETMEIEDHGRKHTVRKLSELEAKALISRAYGFEMSAIIIEAPCWYEATDMNYFRFSVRGWHYEVKNYGALQRYGRPYVDC